MCVGGVSGLLCVVVSWIWCSYPSNGLVVVVGTCAVALLREQGLVFFLEVSSVVPVRHSLYEISRCVFEEVAVLS